MNVNCSFNCPTNLQGQRLRETVTLIKLSSLGWRENNWEQKVRNREREREREKKQTRMSSTAGLWSWRLTTGRERKKTYSTRAVSPGWFVLPWAPRLTCALAPTCSSYLNKNTTDGLVTAAPASGGEPLTARGSGTCLSSDPDLPGRTQRQQQPRGGKRRDLHDGVCACWVPSRVFFRHSCGSMQLQDVIKVKKVVDNTRFESFEQVPTLHFSFWFHALSLHLILKAGLLRVIEQFFYRGFAGFSLKINVTVHPPLLRSESFDI